MNYAERRRSPTKHLIAIAVVVLLHVVIAIALIKGLAYKEIDVIRSPMEAKIIVETSKPSPDVTPPPPPPRMVQLPPVFVPLPEVHIQAPVAPQATITPSVVAPERPVPATPNPSVPAPAVQASPPSVGVACPNSQRVRAGIAYPASAKRDELEGDVLIEFTVAADGSIKDIDIKSSSDRVFNNVSINAVRQFKCNAQGKDVRVSVPFVFKLVN